MSTIKQQQQNMIVSNSVEQKNTYENSQSRQKYNNTTIKYISNKNEIEVEPSEIIFNNIQQNQSYEMIAYVRNLTKKSRRIRVFQPKNNKFRCDYEMQGNIAAGLAMKMIITFDCELTHELHDILKVVSDNGYELEVPLHAYPQQAQILFEPFVNMGFIKVNQTKTQKVQFINEGEVKGNIELIINENLTNIQVDPNKFAIEKGQKKDVIVSYTALDSGIFRGNIQIKTTSQLFQDYIEINATSVDYNRFIIDQQGDQINLIDFDYMYFGQQKEIETILVNNTPKKYKFEVKIRMGVEATKVNSINLQTPDELGYEQTEKIMSVYPEKGVIESYSQMSLTFKCKSRIKQSHRQWVKNYKGTQEEIGEVFNYSAIVEYGGDNENTVLLLQGKGIHPKLMFTKSNLIFGECPQNQQRDIVVDISNKDSKLPLDYNFQQNGYFHMTPSDGILSPNSQQQLIFSFIPKNLGKFSHCLNLNIGNNNWTIPFTFQGTTSTIHPINNNHDITRGIECLPSHFNPERKYIQGEEYTVYQRKKKNKNISNNHHDHTINNIYEETISTIIKQDQNLTVSFNNSNTIQLQNHNIHNSTTDRIKYFDYVRQARQQRVKDNKMKGYKEKMVQLEEKMQQMEQQQVDKLQISQKKNNNQEKNKGVKESNQPPIDYEFLLQDGPRGIEQPHLKLPEQKDNLYVDKHIDKYEPTIIIEDKQFVHNSNQPVKKQFHSQPKTHVEIRDCQSTLTGQKLQKIRVSPQIIDFNTLFIKSISSKTWGIKNDLRESIIVRLESQCVELEKTPKKSQIIPSGQIGVFEIILQSYRLQQFQGFIKYIINDQHEFYFKVQAEIEPVKLNLNKNQIKFGFSEESEEMETSEQLMITNNGNSTAKYMIKQQENSVFIIDKLQGEIKAGENKVVEIIYQPSKNSGGKVEEEKLIFKTEDGQDQFIKCKGDVSETKCEFKQTLLDLKDVCVCQKVKSQITLKNTHKNSTAFAISVDCPYILEIQPLKGRIGPEETKIINIIFQCNEEKIIKQEIVCKIRGGKTSTLQLVANVQLPKLSIVEKEFDFGGIVTLGTPGKLLMTLKNDSNINASLVVDLRQNQEDQDYEGVECLDIQLCKEHQDEIDVIEKLEEEHEDQANEQQQQQQQEDLDKESESSSIDIDGEQKLKIPKYFKINIKPNKVLKFDLTFIPREVQDYNFIIPLYLQGWEQEIPNLQKQVIAVGLKPSLLMEPHEIIFNKKIITTADKLYANVQNVLISNPDQKDIEFQFDDINLNQDKVFQIKPSQGVINSQQNLDINVSFNPYQPGDFEKKVELFINGQQRPYLNLVLKGKGAYPRLVFDRKEVVLPQVPCNVYTKCMFRIINDGYENLNLNCVSQDIQGNKLEISYPDGKNIGVTKKRVRIEVSFISKKPISFCTNLEFSDETSRVYTIPISGIVDNSILTNNLFIQRCPDEFTINSAINQPITLIEDYDDVNSNPDNNNNNNHHNLKAPSLKTGSVVSNKSSVFLGFTPLNNHIIQNNLECTTNWLNQNALINTIQSFPTDVINNNGAQIFELMQFISGKCPVKQGVISAHIKREQKINILVKQYDELLKYLTEYGGCLSTIKPYYLLNFQDMCYYYKTLQDENIAFGALKLNEVKFQYLSNNSWLQVFYQMIKIYYISRINIKQFKTIFPQEIINISIPDYYLNQSNLFNDNEIILLRWLEINYENQNPLNPKRMTNFSTDLQDGQVLSAVLRNYIQSENLNNILSLKSQVYNDEDIKYNAERILLGLKEVGIMTYLRYQDFIKINQIDMMLFCAQLYFQLPNYIPRSTVITFQCVLHETVFKFVELSNPTSKPISYWIKLDGDPDFSIEDQFIKIDSKQTQKVKVKFTSRISQKKYGKITFTNKKENNIQAAALVFNLESEIPVRKTEQIIEVQTLLYTTTELKIPIKNVYSNPNYEQANFKVTIIQEPINSKSSNNNLENSQNTSKANNNKKQNKNQNNSTEINVKQPEITLQNTIPTFYCVKEYIKVRKGETQNFYIQYMPMSLDTHKCKLIFCDENFGEFQYEVIGKALPPDIIDEIRPNQQITVDTPFLHEQLIPFKNEQLLRCKNLHEARLVQSNKYDEKEKFNKIKYTLQESAIFDVEISPQTPFIQIPSTINLVDTQKKSKPLENDKDQNIENKNSKNNQEENKQKKKTKSNNNNITDESNNLIEIQNKLPINLIFKNPIQTTPFLITLKNKDKTDVRIYKLIFNVSPKAIKGNMEMRCPAGEELKQEIPIVNNSDKDWTIKISLLGDQNKNINLFSCVKELIVKKKSQNNFNLSFKPMQICNAEGKLVIQNIQTNDYFEYDIVGIGEEPLAIEHFVINCVAKKQTVSLIEVKNPYHDRSIVYEVETDLINVEGESQIVIEAGRTVKYQMKITPQIGGLYTGQITFYEKENRNRFFWYTVCVNTERPRQEKTVELVSVIRKAVAFDVQLSNPLDEPVTFEVNIQGQDLQGEEIFMLMPKQIGVYELIFSPMRIQRAKGSVSFINEKLGEIWYDLSLVSEDVNFIRLPTLKAELGKCESVQVTLENPTKQEVQVQPIISNQQNFSVHPYEIIIPPFDTINVNIQYSPSELDQNEQGEIRFVSEEIGQWKYQVFGTGLPPTLFPTKNIFSTLMNDVSEIIIFRNPFKDSINVTIQLVTTDSKSESAFSLLSKKKEKITIPGLSPFQIPFCFQPKQMNEFHCEIQVNLSDKINWKFPIKGITECISKQNNHQFKTKARISLETQLRLQLPGLPQLDEGESFENSIENLENNDYGNLIQRSFTLIPVKKTLSGPGDHLIYNVKFQPMRPFKSTIDLIINRQLGGRWIFKLNLESTEPDEDDTIIIHSPLNRTSSVSFKLQNRYKTFSPFQAYFLPDSDSEFSILPKSGELEPLGREGKNFIVSFTPVEYGKPKKGKLIIETDELYWSFIVKGTFPQYKPPNVNSSLVDNNMTILKKDKEEESKDKKKKNYVIDNIKKNQANSPSKAHLINNNNNNNNKSLINQSQKK